MCSSAPDGPRWESLQHSSDLPLGMGARCHCSRTPHPRSALRVSNFGPSFPLLLFYETTAGNNQQLYIRGIPSLADRPIVAGCVKTLNIFVSSKILPVSYYFRRWHLETRRRLRSASSLSPNVRRTRLSTDGDRAFPVAAARTWNSPHPLCLFSELASRPFLFRRFFPWLLPQLLCAVTVVIFGHLNRSFFTFLLTC